MVDQILELAISNGLWAVLFVFLFFYQIKDSSRRERKYIGIIDNLSVSLGVIKKVDVQVAIVHSNILSIKKLLSKKGGSK